MFGIGYFEPSLVNITQVEQKNTIALEQYNTFFLTLQ
jgi:hypothetical protein